MFYRNHKKYIQFQSLHPLGTLILEMCFQLQFGPHNVGKVVQQDNSVNQISLIKFAADIYPNQNTGVYIDIVHFDHYPLPL